MWVLEIDDRAKDREGERRQRIYTAWQSMGLSEFYDNTAAKTIAVEDLILENQRLDYIELSEENLSEVTS